MFRISLWRIRLVVFVGSHSLPQSVQISIHSAILISIEPGQTFAVALLVAGVFIGICPDKGCQDLLRDFVGHAERLPGGWDHPSQADLPFGQAVWVDFVIDLSMFCQDRQLVSQLFGTFDSFSFSRDIEVFDFLELS
jgi:hypothetical protein